ncbi:hypothetical protein WI560_13575 [Bradyrhizobium sp. A11]|uniref:hypothetical protein n=1 Tax=Bradyrhizobium sp. A11 TaxID=3133974 RepID=UPI003246CD67
MALMKAILDRLPALRNSQDFSTIIPELQDRLSIVEAEADDLKSELEDALFATPEKANEVRKRIAANQTEQEELRIAIVGAERRQREAVAAEQMAGIEKRAAGARKIQRDLREQYIELHGHLEAARMLLGKIGPAEAELQAVQVLVSQHKRTDLIVRSPWWHLRSVWGEAISGHVNEYPLQGISIVGYFPNRHPDGPALARMHEVKL